jgi:hypothetical protein
MVSVWDVMVLITGIELLILAVLPIPGYSASNRAISVVIGGALIALFVGLVAVSGIRFPAIVLIGPLIPVLVAGRMISEARKKRSVSMAQLAPGQQLQPDEHGTLLHVKPAASYPIVDEAAADAANPAVDQAVLAQIAYERADLRAIVAGNPAAYPDLLVWLAQFDDPSVVAALAQR